MRWALVLLLLAACQREQRDFSTDSAGRNESAWALAEGKKLFTAFNCTGCHANGGGGMGPPLMDGRWRYGNDPLTIRETILGGRPNGMPSFRGKITEPDLWKLIAYVRSLSGLVPSDRVSARSDHMHATPPQPTQATETPVPETP
jgi:cytochrome c oxidase cbb3-type subunit 3